MSNPDDGYGQQRSAKKDARAEAAAQKAYEKAQRNWFARHKILSALGALFLLGIVVSAANGGGGDDATVAGTSSGSTSSGGTNDAAPKAAPPAEPAPAPAEPAPAEPAIVVTAQELITVLEGNALNAKNTYEGKRVTASGFVGSIDASGDYFSLDPTPDAFVITGVQVQTSEEFLDQVASFSADQAVTVTGTITDVGEVLGYQLEAETIES